MYQELNKFRNIIVTAVEPGLKASKPSAQDQLAYLLCPTPHAPLPHQEPHGTSKRRFLEWGREGKCSHSCSGKGPSLYSQARVAVFS